MVSLGADGEQELGETSVVSFLKSPVRLFEGWGCGTRTWLLLLIPEVTDLPLRAACS